MSRIKARRVDHGKPVAPVAVGFQVGVGRYKRSAPARLTPARVKNQLSEQLTHCSDQLVPVSLAREKMAVDIKRHGDRGRDPAERPSRCRRILRDCTGRWRRLARLKDE